MLDFASIPDGIHSRFVRVADLDLHLHYLEAGTAGARTDGEAVLLLHGWPTSAYLWRHVMGPIARSHRVIAVDLPGFGKSDKPADGSYSFRYHERAIEGLLGALAIERVNLVVHDLGGPLGLYWAVQHPDKVRRLALMNTLVYPRPSWAVVAFVAATYLPLVRGWLSSPRGIELAMKLGVNNKGRIDDAVAAQYQAPFASAAARKVLLRTAQRLSVKGFVEVARKLPSLRVPTRIIYGTDDRILPDVARTMTRVQRDLPHAELTALPGCGHFLQEDEPHMLGEMLSLFLDTPS